MTTAGEIEAAEKVRNAVPWIDALRFTNTGTEATMHALRLARAWTGREVFVKFEGCYHGAHDYVLFTTAGAPVGSLGSRRSPVPLQASSGIPASIRSLVRTVPFNDLDAMERLFKNEGPAIAAMLIEPMMGNCFGMMPEPGYLEGLRQLCDEYGALLIFDEVKTGFRMALGGAQEVFGVTPDMGTFAKSMGNGFPVAAVAGRRDIMDAWAQGGVTQAGTYSGNGVAVAAAAATIDLLSTGEPLARVEKVGTALMEGVASICAAQSVPVQVLGHPSMIGVFFAQDRPTDFRNTAWHDADLYEEVIAGMISRGVMPVDDGLEPWFASAAHSDEDVATTLQAFEEALVDAKA
jgi:glutamate-1-semialdehyde 2,1-aminomutase